MILKIITEDPFKILSSTKRVLERAQFVEIDSKRVKELAKPIKGKLEKGLGEEEYGLGATGNFEKDTQLILVEDSVNFCFWAEKGKDKWQVEWPKGNIVAGGWYGLLACFKRAKAENIHILDAKYLSEITIDDVKRFFRSSSNSEIPLINKRRENLVETGKVLLKKYDGEFVNAIEELGFDAVNIIKLVVENFPSFRDIAKYEGEDVFFLKRAQILANDISYLSKNGKKVNIKNLDKLSAFADYKIPQMLRNAGILVYSDELAEKVDNYVLIPKDSREEVEIRAATIWGIELIRQEIPKFKASEIDNALWLLSQDQTKVSKPYHRTYTIYY